MRWCVIRHPDLAEPAVVAEDSLQHYEDRGYERVSGWSTDPHLPGGQFPPLEGPEPTPEPASAKKAVAKTEKDKESS
jgi:hypothetical protein